MALMSRMLPNKIYLDDVFDNLMFHKINVSDFNKMKCDIYEKDSVYYLEMDIPGFEKNDINIEVDDNDYLTIMAEKNMDNIEEDENKNYLCKERNYGKYQRSFYINGIDKNKIDANFSNGILKVTMPKNEEQKTSKQTIKIN